jgi:ABC-type oligopeptide transport system substrate-binding subunit
MNYCDPQFERYFADQATTADPARRRADFIAMQRIIASGIPMIPLTFMNDIDAVNVRVNGFRRNMLEFPVDPASWDAR